MLLAALLLPGVAAQAQTPLVPAKPTAVTVAPVARSLDRLDVSWTAPAGAVTSYDVEYRKLADTDWTSGAVDITARALRLGALEPSTPYVVRVRATNSVGDGAWSDNGSASTHPPVEQLHYGEARIQRVPADIGPGERFRLLVAIGSTAATSADVETYHAKARGADGRFEETADAARLGPGWRKSRGRYRALVSTPGVDARVHTDTTWTADDKGVPIYWHRDGDHKLDRLADDYEDFYDGGWAYETGQRPWTGSDNDGTQRDDGGVSGVMGEALVGRAGAVDSPLDGGTAAKATSRSVYGLSPVYRVIDAPSDPPLAGPRVLLDTTITIGSYDQDGDGAADRWGWWNRFMVVTLPYPRVTPIVPGRLGGDWFDSTLGTRSMLFRLLVAGDTFQFFGMPQIRWDGSIRDSIGNHQIEFGRPDGTAVLAGVTQSEQSLEQRKRLFRWLSGWKDHVGTRLPLRVLHAGADDVWNATLTPGSGATLAGFGGGAGGTLSKRTFDLAGVTYTVDRLTVNRTGDGNFIDFSTTPDAPPGLRLAIPAKSDQWPIVYPLSPAYRAGDADYRWLQRQRGDASLDTPLDGTTVPVLLTETPGAARHQTAQQVFSFSIVPDAATRGAQVEPSTGAWRRPEIRGLSARGGFAAGSDLRAERCGHGVAGDVRLRRREVHGQRDRHGQRHDKGPD